VPPSILDRRFAYRIDSNSLRRRTGWNILDWREAWCQSDGGRSDCWLVL